MYKGLKVALVIPAYNEEKLIADTLRGVPKAVDRVYVIDDASTDRTPRIVSGFKDRRVRLIRHKENQGCGGAVITGYKKSAEDKFDVTVVVGGDNQMDLKELSLFLEPFVKDEADYVKGNRFLRKSLKIMPKHRIFGNSALSMISKMASGYWKIFDMHDGYTAISRKVIETIDWDRAWKGYGYPSDFLIRLNVHNFRVKDVPRNAIYIKGARQSQIKIGRYIFRVLPMIIRGFFWRLKVKYVLRDFHPLVFFYLLGFILFPAGLLVGVGLVWEKIFEGAVAGSSAVLCALLIIAGLQLLLFGMLFDMAQNDKL